MPHTLAAVALAIVPLIGTVATAGDRERARETLRLKELVTQREAYADTARTYRLEAIAAAEHALQHGHVGTDARPELMLRLAELYHEEFRYQRLKEEEAYIEALERCSHTTATPEPAAEALSTPQ